MSILLGIWLRKIKVNLEYTDYIIVAVAFLICIAVGIFLHIAWMWDKKPTVNIYDLWQAIGAKERAEFAVNLCKSHGPLFCGTLRNLKKCIGGKDVADIRS